MLVTQNCLADATRELENARAVLRLTAAEASAALELLEWVWHRQRFDEPAQAAAFGQAAAFTAVLTHRGELPFGEFAQSLHIDAQKFMLALRDVSEKARLAERVAACLAQAVSQYAFFKTVQRKMALLFTRLNLAAPFETPASRLALQCLAWSLFLAGRLHILRGSELISESIALMLAVVAAVLQEGVTYSQTLALEGGELAEEETLKELARLVGARNLNDLLRAAAAFTRFKADLTKQGVLPEICSSPGALSAALLRLEEHVKARMPAVEFELAHLTLGTKASLSLDSSSRFASPAPSSRASRVDQGSSYWQAKESGPIRCQSPLPSTASLEAAQATISRVPPAELDDLKCYLYSSIQEGLSAPKATVRRKLGSVEAERFFDKHLPSAAERIIKHLSAEALPPMATREQLCALALFLTLRGSSEDCGGASREFLLTALCLGVELILQAWGLQSALGRSFAAADLPVDKALRLHSLGLRWEQLLPAQLVLHGRAVDRHLLDFSLFGQREQPAALHKKDPLWALCTEHAFPTVGAVCFQLQISRSAQVPAQRLFESLLGARISLFAGRSMSQIVLCCIYATCKLGALGIKFGEILSAFARTQCCHAHCAHAATHQPEHVIKFYNREFVRAMADASMREKSTRAAFESPTQKTEVKPRTSELGGRSSGDNSARPKQIECGTRVLKFRAE